jgi:hypothetical protein
MVTYIMIVRDEILLDAQSDMNTQDARDDLTEGDVKAIAGYVSASIIGGPWAVMDEWGTGSLMDPENPALASYRNSELWNPERHDLARRGRPMGSYTDIFGEKHVSSGNSEGLNLEVMAETGKLPPSFLPTPPSHALQKAFEWMDAGSFQKHLRKAIATFPWGKYLKVTNTKG